MPKAEVERVVPESLAQPQAGAVLAVMNRRTGRQKETGAPASARHQETP